METQTQQGAPTAPDTRTAWTIDPTHSTIGFSVKLTIDVQALRQD